MSEGDGYNPAGRIREYDLAGERLFLEIEGGHAILRNMNRNESLEISGEEGAALLNRSVPKLIRDLQYNGLISFTELRSTGLLDRICNLRSNVPTDKLCVMLDNTTVYNATNCIRGYMSPLGLLDMAVLAFASICFDNVVIQPPKYEKFNEFFTYINYPDDFIRDDLWSICARMGNELAYGDSFVTDIERSWENFLNISGIDLRKQFTDCSWGKYQDSPNYWDGILSSHYDSFIQSHSLVGKGQVADRDELLSIETMRTMYNDSLASLLGIPYLSSSFRGCIHSKIISRKIETRLLLDKLISAIGPEKAEPNKDAPYTTECSAPFILGIIREQMDKPTDFWPILMEYREKFRPIRDNLRKERDKWDGHSGQYIKKYTKHLTSSMNNRFGKIEDTIETGISIGLPLATSTPAITGFTTLGIKLLKLLNPTEKLSSIYLKNFKPDLYVIQSLADEASQLHMIEDKIELIWDRRMLPIEHKTLEFFASSHPGEFLRLRNVG